MKSCSDEYEYAGDVRTIDWIDDVTLFQERAWLAGVASTHRARLSTTRPPSVVRNNADSDMADEQRGTIDRHRRARAGLVTGVTVRTECGGAA